MILQSVIRTIYPPQCLTCDTQTEVDFALCGSCWAKTPFITGLVCDACGVPLMGEGDHDIATCDDCLATPRPWGRGRAALEYRDGARKIVLGLKHGDRTDLARPAAFWMVRAAAPLVVADMIVVPVPLHWTRLLRRRYNQAALLGQQVARDLSVEFQPDTLVRPKRSKMMEAYSRDARFEALSGAIEPAKNAALHGRPVLLVDDVMTTGATLSACCDALKSAGAGPVSILTLARAVKDT